MREAHRIEVNGKTGLAIIRGFGTFSLLGSELLLAEGIGTVGADGLAQVQPDAWYPLDAWLRVLRRIEGQFGDRVLTQIGSALVGHDNKSDPEIHGAIRNLDGAYHRNHRLDGQPMWDPAQGVTLEGIGHYGYEAVANHKVVVSRCDNPYPCAFDKGILLWLAQRWDPMATVAHDPRECRKSGGQACTYRVSWTRS